MSLVNQMLRDLEKRRAGERQGSGVFNGLIATGEARRSALPLWILGGLAVVLGGTVAYLLWTRPAEEVEAAPNVALMAPVAQLHAAVVAPPAPAPEPAPPEPEPVPITPGPAPAAEAAPPQPEPPRQRTGPARQAAAAPRVAPPAPESAPAPVALEKKLLPPTPQQLAAAAYQRGYDALRAGRRDEAERELRAALGHEPEHLAAREALAGMLLSAGRRVEAAEVLEAGIRLQPEGAGLRKLHGRLLVEQGDLPAAIASLEAGAVAAARDAEYQALLAALYQRSGAYAKSVQRYQQALSLEPRQGIWWLGLGISSEGAGQKQEAVAAFRHALESGLGEKLGAYARERLQALEGN